MLCCFAILAYEISKNDKLCELVQVQADKKRREWQNREKFIDIELIRDRNGNYREKKKPIKLNFGLCYLILASIFIASIGDIFQISMFLFFCLIGFLYRYCVDYFSL